MAQRPLASNINIQPIASAMDGNQKDLATVSTALTAFVQNLKTFKNSLKDGNNNIDIKSYSSDFLNALKVYTNVVQTIADIDMKKLKNISNANSLTKITNVFKDIVTSLQQGFAEMVTVLGTDDSYNKLKAVLTPQKTTKERKNVDENGVGEVKTETKESGSIMDCVSLMLNVCKQLNDTGKINVRKTVRTFKKQILGTFIQIFDACIDAFRYYKPDTVSEIYKAVRSVDKITTTLGVLLQRLAEPAVKMGSQRRVLLNGFNLIVGDPEGVTGGWVGKKKRILLGNGKHHYLMGVLMTVFEDIVLIDDVYGKEATKAIRTVGNITEMINSLAKSFALIGMLAIPVSIGMFVLTGTKGKGGLLRVLRWTMVSLAKSKKDINQATTSLVLMSSAIFMLSATAFMISLSGMFVIQNWASIGMTLLFTAGLVLLMHGLGSKLFKKEIEGGTKSLLILSTAILLLTMTAVAIVYTGQFISASWDSILQVGLMIVTLGFTMWLLSCMKNKFEDAGKSVLLMVASVALLGITAVLLVWVSSLLAPNWVNLLIVMGVIVAMGLLILGINAMMEKVKDMNKILLFSAVVAILSASMLILGVATNMINTEGGIATFLVVAIGMVAVVAVFAGLVKFLGELPVPVLLAGVIALTAICGLIILINRSIASLADAVKTITETAKMVKDEDWGNKSIASYILKPMLALMEASLMVSAMTPILLLATPAFTSLFLISSSIGHMAKVVRDIASLNMPVAFNKDGKATKYEKMKPEDFARAAENGAGVAKIFMALFGWKATTLNILGTSVTIEPIKLTEMAKVSRFARKRMKRLNKIVGFIGNMAKTIQDIASLRVPVFDEKTGEQKGYQRMQPDDFVKASENACTIAKTLVGMFSDVKFRAVLWSIDEDSAETMGIVLKSVGNLSNVLNVVATLASGKIPLGTEERDGKVVITQTVPLKDITDNTTKISDNIKDLVMCVVRGVAGIDEDLLDDAEDMVKDLDKVVESAVNSTTSIINLYKEHLKDLDVDDLNSKYEGTHKTLSGLVGFFEGKKFTNSNATAFSKQATSLTNILKQVDKTDLSKLKYAYSLVSKLADFAKEIRGDFDKLAECISEDLIEALKELNGTLEGTNKNINLTTPSTTAEMLPNKSGSDKEKTSNTSVKDANAMKERISVLERELEELRQQMKMPRIKTDPSTGAVVVKMLN